MYSSVDANAKYLPIFGFICFLNRKQFARPIVTPSIPAWQLQSQQSIANATTTHDDDADKHDDNGSGGSSETEVVTKHSDSSLELM